MQLEKVKAFGNWKAPTTFSLDPNLLLPPGMIYPLYFAFCLDISFLGSGAERRSIASRLIKPFFG